MRKTENIINRTGINKTECKKTGHSKENKIPGGWNGSLFFLIIILGITLGIFAGCKNIFVPEPPATPEAAGPGGGITVPLRLFTGSARSVMPGMESLIWEITATSGGAKATVLGEYPNFKISFPSKGEWTIEVKGKSGTEPDTKEIFTGNTTMEITGSTVSISIPLSPGSEMGEGTGTIDLTMTVPTDVKEVKYKLDGESGFTDLTLTDGSYSLNKTGVSAGIRTLFLYFLDGNGTTVYMCTETVNVWNGVTSNQWIKTNDEEYINYSGDFVITGEMVDNFVKTMGSVVFVDASVKDDEPATGSIFAPVNSVSTAVDILRKANSGGKCNGTIMVSGETTIKDEIVVNSGETLTIKGMEAGASIKNTSGRVFKITGGSLTLEENITLTGIVTDDNGGAVYVNGGTFTMESGSKITRSSAQNGGGVYVNGGEFEMNGTATLQGNKATTHGGGVHIFSDGTFTMNDGTIGGTAANTAKNGGGVFVSDGTFNMKDGTISGNTATSSGGGVYVYETGEFTMEGGTIGGDHGASANSSESGGGVCVYKGDFTMSDGSISGNKATSTSSHACGGGVYVNGGNFTMSGEATIQGNNASTTDTNSAAGGGGVYVNGGTFTLTGTAKIQGNTTTSVNLLTKPSGGGGVFVIAGGTFTMSGGTIGGTEANSANEADLGGGVYIGVNTDTREKGSFTMGGGTITGNTADKNGGGVYVQDGTFTMMGGTIGGTTANTAEYGGGVCVDGTSSIFYMHGNGTITKNNANLGGGVYVGSSGSFGIGESSAASSPVVSGNTKTGNFPNNVYLDGTILLIDGDLNKLVGSGNIGITMATPGVFTSDWSKSGLTGTTFFFSDDESYKIELDTSSGECKLVTNDSEVKYEVSGITKSGTFAEAVAAVNNNSTDGGTITLLKDIDGSNAVFGADSANSKPISFTGGTEEKPIILDLNGHTIDRALETAQAQEDGTVISVSGALMLKDSTGSGKITGGNNNNRMISGTWGGGVCVQGGAFFTMEGGNISYNLSEIGGGGVYVCNDGSFTMTGGTIGGSDANDANKDKSGGGGGVFVNGEFTMSGGTITGNSTGTNGGGVAVTADGTFTMSGTAVISANKALNGSGGGVCVFGNFTMTGGTIGGIEPNTAVLGGGVYVGTDNFTLGPSSTGSTPVISGNEETDTSPNNVYLYNGKTLSITGKLKKAGGSGNIGISMATPGVFTSNWSSSGSTDSTFFFSDDTERNVALSGSELSLNLVRVEGGSCTLNGQNVTLSSFWISSYEVTQAEFVSIMTGNQNDIASNPSYFPDNPAAGEVQERRPVEQVRWYDAIVYCNLLSIKEGLTPCYTINGSTVPADWRERPVSDVHDNYNGWNSVTCNFDADGYRLPTEAEWEYAARGGNPKDSSWNNTYSGSDTLEDVAWYSNNSDSKTHEVGKKQANALGLYDMSGNLKEWCWNRKSEDNDSRVMRGGYYSSGEDGCQVTAVDSNFPISQGPDQGFRVVRSAR